MDDWYAAFQCVLDHFMREDHEQGCIGIAGEFGGVEHRILLTIPRL